MVAGGTSHNSAWHMRAYWNAWIRQSVLSLSADLPSARRPWRLWWRSAASSRPRPSTGCGSDHRANEKPKSVAQSRRRRQLKVSTATCSGDRQHGIAPPTSKAKRPAPYLLRAYRVTLWCIGTSTLLTLWKRSPMPSAYQPIDGDDDKLYIILISSPIASRATLPLWHWVRPNHRSAAEQTA